MCGLKYNNIDLTFICIAPTIEHNTDQHNTLQTILHKCIWNKTLPSIEHKILIKINKFTIVYKI